MRCQLRSTFKHQRTAEVSLPVAHEVVFAVVLEQCRVVLEHLELRQVGVFAPVELLLAQFLADVAEVMRLHVMFVQLLLVIVNHAHTEVTVRMILPIVFLQCGESVHLLLECEHRFEL